MEKFCTATGFVFLLLSSLKATSRTQWQEFSIPQCARMHFSIVAAMGAILETYTKIALKQAAVYTIAVDDNGDVYVGGIFTIAGGVAANNIAKWNGTSWEAIGSVTNSAVQNIAIKESDLFAGGDFTMAGGKVNNYFAHLTTQCPVNNSFKTAENTDNSTQENSQSQKELSLAMNSNTQVIYYPNPATRELIVVVNDETTDGNYEVVIPNLIGQKVISKHFTGKTELDVSGIRPTGLSFCASA